jgi:hypothetical protein
MSPASVRGDPRGEVFSSQVQEWGAKTRRGIPVAIPTHHTQPRMPAWPSPKRSTVKKFLNPYDYFSHTHIQP